MISLSQHEATGASSTPSQGATQAGVSDSQWQPFLFRISALLFSSFVFVAMSRLALMGFLSSCIFAGPSGDWSTLSSIFLLLPIILLAPAIGRLLCRQPAEKSILPAYLCQPVVLALISLSLPACSSSRWLTGLLMAWVVLSCETFWMAGTNVVPTLAKRAKWQPVNALRFLANLSATMLALACFSNLPLTLPELLRVSSLVLMVSAIPLASPKQDTGEKDFSHPGQQKLSNDKHSSAAATLPSSPRAQKAASELLLWSAVALSCSIPLTTLFLFAIDVNSPLSWALSEYCRQAAWGCLGGVLIALVPCSSRLRISLLAIPAGCVSAGCFICFVEPNGINANIALLLIGAAAAFSYIQLDTRMQRLVRRRSLARLIGWRWALCCICFLFAAVVLKPQLDNISATMVLRLLSALTIICTTVLLGTALLFKALLETRSSAEPTSAQRSKQEASS